MTSILLAVVVVLNVLLFGWNITLQMQPVDNKFEPDNIPSQLQKNIRLLESISDQKKLNDAIKKIKYLELDNLTLKKNNIQLNAYIKELQMNLTSYIKKQDTKNKNLNQAINLINTENDQIKNLTLTIAKNVQKTTFYGPYYAIDWWWPSVPVYQQILAHLTFAKITIEKKSLVTFTINGHVLSNGQTIQMLFLKDKQPIVQKSGDWYYYSYYTTLTQWVTVSFVQDAVIEPGTFIFEVGLILPGNQPPQQVSVNGIGYTIKVLELEDTITIPQDL